MLCSTQNTTQTIQTVDVAVMTNPNPNPIPMTLFPFCIYISHFTRAHYYMWSNSSQSQYIQGKYIFRNGVSLKADRTTTAQCRRLHSPRLHAICSILFPGVVNMQADQNCW